MIFPIRLQSIFFMPRSTEEWMLDPPGISQSSSG